MSKMNSMLMGICFLLSSLFSCQQSKGDFKTVPVKEFASLIEDASVQRLDVRTMAEYSEGHIPGTININVLDDSFAVMADSTLQKDKSVALYCRSGKDIKCTNWIKDSMPGRKQARKWKNKNERLLNNE
mgnify:CR=1 FL=1